MSYRRGQDPSQINANNPVEAQFLKSASRLNSGLGGGNISIQELRLESGMKDLDVFTQLENAWPTKEVLTEHHVSYPGLDGTMKQDTVMRATRVPMTPREAHAYHKKNMNAMIDVIEGKVPKVKKASTPKPTKSKTKK